MSDYDSYLESSLEYLKEYIADMKVRPIFLLALVFLKGI